MKIKNILMAGVVAITSISLPTLANAETSYATPQELLIEALEVAVSGVESTTYDGALDYVESLITVNGSEVSYDGDVIGYWDSDNSDTLFADSAFTDEVLSNGGTNIWEFDPDILSPILTDFNNNLIETIVPTTTDWSKIIGKYDVTFGNVTIPADQWVTCTPGEVVKFYDVVGHTIGTANKRAFVICTYYFDNNNELWLQNGYTTVGDIKAGNYYRIITGSLSTAQMQTYIQSPTATTTPYMTFRPFLNYATYPTYYTSRVHDMGYSVYSGNELQDTSNFSKVTDASSSQNIHGIIQGTVPVKSYGWFWVEVTDKVSNFATETQPAIHTYMNSRWNKAPESSKQQIGNTTLKQRLSKFSSLVEGDTIEVTPTAWTIKGLGGEESDFDTYLGSQDVMAPGEETSIPATADIEALAFKVVLPTSLPIYVNELNQVSVATNATIKNESGAAVIVNSVNIEAKPDSGWTLLTSGTPSKARDAKEFTFTTDLAANTVLAVAEERPFRYNAELSPSTEGVEQLDLASVLVTIDWAPNL